MFRPTPMVAIVLLLLFPVCTVTGASWPSHRDGLHLAFQSALHPTTAYRADGTAIPGWQFEALGRGRLRHDGALLIGHGGFKAPALGGVLGDVFEDSTAFSVTLSLTSAVEKNSGNILALGGAAGPNARWLEISQEDKQVQVRLHTSAAAWTLSGGKVTPEQQTSIALTWDGTVLTLFQDGEAIARQELTGTLRFTNPTIPVIGQLQADVRGWQGAVAGMALYSEALMPETVSTIHRTWANLVAAQAPVKRLGLRATLREKSSVYLPSELAPYERGLTVFVYDVVEVLDGAYEKDRVYVAHWTVLDRESLPFADAAIGTTHELQLELFDENPQLESENLSDDAVIDFSIPYYYDAGGRSLHSLPAETRP